MIKIQYQIDVPEEIRHIYCAGCNCKVTNNSVRISFYKNEKYYLSFTLCDKCRRELYRKI